MARVLILNGHDIKRLKAKSVRKNIDLVQQDIYLFAGTVTENIRDGKPHAAKKEIMMAA